MANSATPQTSQKQIVSLPIAGSVLPLQRAEELILTLAGVISVRIVVGEHGAVEEIHVLTTDEVPPKQTVRNIESALLAHLGMRVDHRKISIATSSDSKQRTSAAPDVDSFAKVQVAAEPIPGRRLYFEDVEVRGSRSKGLTCRVTLRKGKESFTGEATGVESDRSRVELAARATIGAILSAEAMGPQLGFHGVKVLDLFEREYVVVGVLVQAGRMSKVLTGTCEVQESAETAGALAVLDATNRWIDFDRG